MAGNLGHGMPCPYIPGAQQIRRGTACCAQRRPEVAAAGRRPVPHVLAPNVSLFVKRGIKETIGNTARLSPIRLASGEGKRPIPAARREVLGPQGQARDHPQRGEPAVGRRYHLHPAAPRVRLPGRAVGRLLAAGDWLGRELLPLVRKHYVAFGNSRISTGTSGA